MKTLLFSLILVALCGIKYIIDDLDRISDIVDHQIPHIAAKGYLTGCVDAGGKDCQLHSDEYEKSIQDFLRSFGAD